MKIQSLMNAGSWLPYNRELAIVFGADVAILFSELCHLSEQFGAEKNDGWFFAPSARLAELTGMKRTPLERCLLTLCKADLLLIDAKGIHNTRHFKLEQSPQTISAICAAHASQPAQTPDRAPKTQPRAKQTANKPQNHTEQPLEMVEFVGIPEQLPTEKPKTDKAAAKKAEIEAAAVRLIEHFNAVAGTAFRTNGKGNIEDFSRVLRTKEGTEEEIRMVIELKVAQWAKKPEMREYLKPVTLTRPIHFIKYLEEAYAAKSQPQRPQPSAFAHAHSDGLTIDLPNGQRFGDYFDRKDQRKVDMIKATLVAHPGIHIHLNPQLADMAYLSSINEAELQQMLKRARMFWRPENFYEPSTELPF